ncbi:Gamma-aminobutyric acid (GABA) B receptor [Seminavis robusta]|uniref:Gamma-aminobutyric acid (GABA) B receptor n=1 Tax=Seminavis robusta TaxID=568900 RepID=A0A9N8D9U1_9STRA|nr:Gamma-aminobutyric acid (GABA) B receptor [Seminavis robusta]|eukprot:Sro49_g028710.1 Gamma-aminobutyric acid (GABA) B receptor (960) ;mRNA; r:92913-96111
MMLRPRAIAGPLLGLVVLTATVLSAEEKRGPVLTDDLECQLVALLPFSDEREGPPKAIQDEGVEYYGYGIWPDKETLEKASFTLMLTAELAVKHFNERDASIVPEIADIDYCNITFPSILYRDSGYSRPMAVDALLDITRQAASNNQDPTKAMCAVIGPTHPRVNEGVSAVTENLWIPQMAYSTIDRRLSRRADFPTLARTITSSQDYGFAIANFVQRDVVERKFLAIIYDASDYGEQYEDPLEDAEDFLEEYATITEHIIEGDRGSIEESLETTVEDGYHSILLATDRLAVLDDVADVAADMGLLGDDYFWMLSGDMLTPAMLPHIQYKVDSPTDKLLRGAAVFTNYDPFKYYGEADPFLRAWRNQPDSIAEHFNEPMNNPLNKTILSSMETAGYFRRETPTEYASFLYDSIVLTGLSACKAHSEGGEHVAEVFETEFQGASGYVQFSQSHETSELALGRLNGRDISGVIYGMYNLRPTTVDENDMQSYELVLTHLYTNDTQVEGSDMPVPGSWVPVEGTEFLFYDGTTNEPQPLKTTAEWNYLSPGIHAFGLFLCFFALVLAVGAGVWVYAMREDRIVKASQPEFLYLLCLGSAMVAFSIFFISWDEDKGVSEDTLSGFCSAFPWFFVIGYQVMYLALFFKLWRLSKLLSMRRQAVQINQVLIPFGIVIFLSVIILMVWQIVDPLVWSREITNADEEGQWISYAECNSTGDAGALPFIIPLAIIIFISVIMTGAISWKLKDVQAELAESKWIFFAIFSHVQVWAIGIPVFVILDGVSRDASYLIMAALAFIFSVTLVALVIWPKMYVWTRNHYFGGPPKPRMSISVGKSQTVVSGLDTAGGTGSTMASNTSFAGADRARAEANARRVVALENEMEEMRRIHEQERSHLSDIVHNLESQQNGLIMDAEVHAAPPAPTFFEEAAAEKDVWNAPEGGRMGRPNPSSDGPSDYTLDDEPRS